LVLAVAAGCQSARRDENSAAKERFLSGTVQKPVERGLTIDVSKLGRDPAEMEKAQLLGATQVVSRLQTFRFHGTSEYATTRGRNKVRLAESFSWNQGPQGSFSTKVENSRGYGLETWWTGSKFYLRTRYGKVRERPVEGKEYLTYRDDVWSSWAAVYRLFKGHLSFTEATATSVGGRRAKRYEIALSETPLTRVAETLGAQPDKIDLGDIKVATAQRHAWRRAARPVTASGTVDVDAETGAPLAISFRGKVQLPDRQERTDLTLSLRAKMEDVGGSVAVRPPDDSIVEPVMRKIESKRFDLIDMVRIEDFLIDKWEFPNEKGASPKTGVTWRQARDACRSVGKRLCTLKEWQKACNSDRTRNRYPYGLLYKADRCNTESRGPRPSGERRECRGEFEVYDLTGNVGEWVETKGKEDRKAWCVAGGAYDDKDKARCTRCVARESIEEPDAHVGFRCCR
jgi:hypothetical protein